MGSRGLERASGPGLWPDPGLTLQLLCLWVLHLLNVGIDYEASSRGPLGSLAWPWGGLAGGHWDPSAFQSGPRWHLL